MWGKPPYRLGRIRGGNLGSSSDVPASARTAEGRGNVQRLLPGTEKGREPRLSPLLRSQREGRGRHMGSWLGTHPAGNAGYWKTVVVLGEAEVRPS